MSIGGAKVIVGAMVLMFARLGFADEEQFPSGKMCTIFHACDEKITKGKAMVYLGEMLDWMPDECSYKCDEIKAMKEGQTLPCRFQFENCKIMKKSDGWYLDGTCPARGSKECFAKAIKEIEKEEKQHEKEEKNKKEEKKENEGDGTSAGYKKVELKMLVPIIALMAGFVLWRISLRNE